MRHRKSGRKFGRNASHRRAMLSNLVTSLFKYERIQTTDAKAKELRRIADKLISLGKRGDLHARRLALRTIRDREVLAKLFSTIAPRNEGRSGGYTRKIKVGFRKGDNAAISVVELVERGDVNSPSLQNSEAKIALENISAENSSESSDEAIVSDGNSSSDSDE